MNEFTLEEAKTKKVILDTVSDLVAKFMYYDRKEDEELGVGAIDSALENSIITLDEIMDRFKSEILKSL